MFEIMTDGKIFTLAHKLEEKPDINKYRKHIHPFCEILLAVGSEVEFNIDGKVFAIKPFDLVIIPQAVYHNITAVKPIPYENYVVDFYSDIMPREYEEKLFSQPRTVNVKNDRILLGFFKLLDVYHSMYNEGDFILLSEMVLCEMTMYLTSNLDKYEAATADRSKLVEMILKEIAENPTANIDSAYLSRKLMFSQSYIQNVFSSQMKIGLKQYIMQKRIFSAHNDILNGELPIEVAKKYGFADYSSFYRQYKKHIGVSPRGK